MNFELSEEQKKLRDTTLKFAREELSPGAAERDRTQQFSRELWLKCAEQGMLGLAIPAEYGGQGLSPLSTVVALEALGYGSEDSALPFAMCAQLFACMIPIWKHGSEEQRRRYLPELCHGTLIAANAMTEPDGGSDAFSLNTRAVPTGDGYLINGEKAYITHAPHANVALVYTMTDADKGFSGGITAFLVDTDTAGVSAGPVVSKMGIRSCPFGEFSFRDVAVPQSSVVGSAGHAGPVFAQSMEWERICLVAIHLGTMQRLLDRAVRFAKTRKSFGKPICKHQAVSHRIADMKVRLEASRLLVHAAASRLDSAPTSSLDASITKLFVSESLVKSALATIQILGGYGFTAEAGVERTLRDSIGSTIYSGTSDMQRNIIAAWLGL
jgi:alkylation response protein AidB-like acyl-CoA dehydrogenase